MLTDRGLEVATARTEIARIVDASGPIARDDAELRCALGVDVTQMRRRLESTFGKMAVHEAARQVRRRPRWRGRARHSPLCGPPYLIRRAQFIACTTAGKRGEAEIRPEHLSMACCASRVTRSALVWAAARPPASACTPAHRIECGWCWPSTESTSIGSARTCSTAERPDPAERRRSHDTSH
jgi:hypothetical protein